MWQLTGRFRDGSFVDVDALRTQIDALMSDKLQLLTPDMVKKVEYRVWHPAVFSLDRH